MTTRGKQLTLFAAKKGIRHIVINAKNKACPKYVKPKKILTSKIHLKAYMASKDIDIRVGIEAFDEIENILENFLDTLLDTADKNKKNRKSKVLSGKDIIVALSHEDMNIDSIRNSCL